MSRADGARDADVPAPSSPKGTHAGSARDSRTLDAVPAGATVVLLAVDDALPADFREQLAAYGFVPGRTLTVSAQRPMTVVVCDHVELALERSVARALVVRGSGPQREGSTPRAGA